jgi:hypothetical protein
MDNDIEILENEKEILEKLDTVEEEIRRGNFEAESILLILEGGLVCGAIALGIWASPRAASLGIIIGCFVGFFYCRSSPHYRRR